MLSVIILFDYLLSNNEPFLLNCMNNSVWWCNIYLHSYCYSKYWFVAIWKYIKCCLTVCQARRSNMRHRPIGIGVQGLADAFLQLRYPFESQEAQQLNRDIFETIYYAALKTSCELAERFGRYETYEGSPISQGVSIVVIVAAEIAAICWFDSTPWAIKNGANLVLSVTSSNINKF